jgi:hypothetical protein
MKKGQATTRCLPRAKANSLTKAERAATARKKAAADRKGDRVVPNTDKAKVRLREGFAHEMSNSDFDKMTNILNDKSKADQIHSLLVQMFSSQKELLDYNYKNDLYAEFKRFIHGIENYSLEGPINISYTDLKLDPEVYAERDKKYNDYVEGKIDKYFRDTNSDPRKLDLSKVPPITVDENGEVMDGNHRAFLAIKQQKPLKGYKIVAKQNSHPNVQKILALINNEIKEAINPLGWEPIIKAENEEIERTADELGLPYDVVYNSFVNGDEVTLTDEMWSRLENTDSYDINSEEEAIELARYYGKDIQSILAAEKTPPALILQYSPNKYYLVGGNTRLMVARAKGINPQVILATIEPSNKYAYQDVNDIGADLTEEYDVESEEDYEGFIMFMKEYSRQLTESKLTEAEYRGRKVQLGKIMQGDIKKFKVYVKNAKGKVVKVNFGFGGKSAKGKRMVIKAKNPKRRAAYRARHNCSNPGPRWKANYWSCKKW